MGAPADRGEDIRTKVNRETSRIAWKDLERHFDQVEVAFQMSADNAVQIRQWMTAGKFGKVTDEQAGIWFEADAQLWAVVVSPWVLVQQVANGEP